MRAHTRFIALAAALRAASCSARRGMIRHAPSSQIDDALPTFLPEGPSLPQITRKTNEVDDNPIVIPRIVGGAEAQRSRYSYMASLQKSDGSTICGGTLVAPDVVLSAAHCAGIFDRVAIGMHDVYDDNYDVYDIEASIAHPWYSFTDENMDINFDFLLIKLNATVPEDKYRPVGLNRNSKLPRKLGDAVTVLGWGTIDTEATQMSEYLRRAELEYVPNDDCEASGTWIDGKYYSYQGFIEENMLCAWGDEKDACLGDSGGPLIVEGTGTDYEDSFGDVQVGVVSFGVGCANPDFPAIYARVSDQLWWLDAVVCGLSSDPPSSFRCEDVPDSDGDGVPDVLDLCPHDGIAEGPKRAQHGCPDEDEDGVPDMDDLCEGTRKGLEVDAYGCGTESPTSSPTAMRPDAPPPPGGPPGGPELDAPSSPSPPPQTKTLSANEMLLTPYALAGIGGALFLLLAATAVACLRRRRSRKGEGLSSDGPAL